MVLSQCKINRRCHVIWKGARLGSVKKRRAIKVWIFHNGWSSDVKWHLTRTVIVNNQKLFNWIRLRYFLFHTHPPNWRRFRGSDGSEVQCAIKRGQVHWTSQSLLVQWPFYNKKIIRFSHHILLTVPGRVPTSNLCSDAYKWLPIMNLRVE